MLVSPLNVRFREDTRKMINDIAKRGNGTPSQLVRHAMYTFLDRYYSDPDFRIETKKHFSGLTRSRETMYVSENEAFEERQQGVLKLEEAFK